MIKQISVCNKCGKELNSCVENNRITIKWDDKYFTNSTKIHLCDGCHKEFMRNYLHKNIWNENFRGVRRNDNY